VALDERGKALSTVEFAQWLGKQQQAGKDLAFVIGGDEGLSEQVRTRATLVLCLSRFTLPHRLARLVLMEQLYRAFTVLRGEAYHRG
jgi:23S rRNA (pseudouridine1915-N3)-methyltransferase